MLDNSQSDYKTINKTARAAYKNVTIVGNKTHVYNVRHRAINGFSHVIGKIWLNDKGLHLLQLDCQKQSCKVYDKHNDCEYSKVYLPVGLENLAVWELLGCLERIEQEEIIE